MPSSSSNKLPGAIREKIEHASVQMLESTGKCRLKQRKTCRSRLHSACGDEVQPQRSQAAGLGRQQSFIRAFAVPHTGWRATTRTAMLRLLTNDDHVHMGPIFLNRPPRPSSRKSAVCYASHISCDIVCWTKTTAEDSRTEWLHSGSHGGQATEGCKKVVTQTVWFQTRNIVTLWPDRELMKTYIRVKHYSLVYIISCAPYRRRLRG